MLTWRSLHELTAVEGDFADHNPLGGEVELQPEIPANSVMQFDGHITSVFHDDIRHVGEKYWLTEELMTANTKVHFGMWKDLHKTYNIK